MELTVLGKYGPYPPAGGACSGYLLDTGAGKLLLDCGSGVLSRLMALGGPGILDGVVLSHLHFDHMSDLLPMVYASQFAAISPIALYLPAEPAAICGLLRQSGAYGVHILETDGQWTVAGARMRVHPAAHPAPGYALRLEKDGKAFVYSGDTNQCPGLAEFCRGADLLLCDGCFTQAQWAADKPHLSAEKAARLAAQAGVKKLVLTHVTPGCDEALLLAEARQAWPAGDIVPAREAQSWNI
ncbi:MAG: MBL fold metallo-hydrolase [Eubacteriales bacterium]|nr:MBL fold metallo-hydrolase [Eubacteriales bacterium]